MSRVDNTRRLIHQGQTDRITSIPLSIPKYNEYLYGLRQKSMITLLAESSVGKTSFARDKYINEPYEYFRSINDPTKLDIEFIDFCLEIDAETNIGSDYSRRIYLDHGRVIPTSKMFGWQTGNRLTTEESEVIETYTEYMEAMEKKITVVEGEIGPSVYHDVLFEAAKRNGKFIKEGSNIGNSYGYIPNNPNKFVIVLFDTINLVELEEKYNTTKSAIDRISRLSVLFRNTCKFTFIILQQISAEMSSTDRARFGINTPQMRDAEDSRRTTKDSNIVLALYDPIPHMKEEQTIFKGYDISILKSWFKSLHILKHREGVKHKYIPLKSHGAIPYFEQLPPPELMNEQEYIKATRH